MKKLNKLVKLGFVLLMVATVLFLNSCKKDDDNNNVPTNSNNYKGIFVLNEGGFQKGNASVDYRGIDSTITESIFSKVNSRPLGDIMQSMTKVGDKFYLIVNNSQKIEVVNTADFKSVATIEGLASPRFLQTVSGSSKAYVTDLFAGEIHIINLSSNTKTGSIAIGGWSENMVEVGNEVYVNNWSNKKIYEINTGNDAVTDSIALTGAPNGLVKDKNGKLWVLVDSTGTNKAKLMRINPSNNNVEATIEFDATQSASKLAINGTGDKLYYINSVGVYEMDITATALPTTTKKSGYFYGLGIDPADGSIYVSDALDFNQKGIVFRIKADGTESNFKAGIAPNGFFFNY
jgi:DNA-binding beta-propeller fold protein YncE